MNKLSSGLSLLVAGAAACGGSVVSSESAGSTGAGAGTTTGTGAGTTATTTTTGTGGGCTTDAQCGCLLNCCGGQCVNLANDILNCGACGNACAGPHPYCDVGGKCAAETPCQMDAGACGAGACCGTECCPAGQLCCTVNVAVTFTKCQAPTAAGTCDVGAPCTTCTAPDTPVATPDGERAIASLAEGDLVYSVEDEAIVAVPVARASRIRVHHHHVVEVTLAGGAVLRISPGHPTADGRSFAALVAGDRLGEVAVAGVRLVPYEGDFTYDILPASKTGDYFAAGALVGSTLSPARGEALGR